MPHRKEPGGITVDAAISRPIPPTSEAAHERNHRLAEGLPKDHTAPHQPYKEYAGHPALKGLKKAKHVHEVY
jgi:hypothetical protein